MGQTLEVEEKKGLPHTQSNASSSSDGKQAEDREEEQDGAGSTALAVMQAKDVQKMAEELAEKLKTGKDRKLLEEMQGIGADLQLQISEKIALLEKPLSVMMQQGGTNEKISQDLVELRSQLQKLNPKQMSDPDGVMKVLVSLFGWMPFIGEKLRNGAVAGAMAKYASRYQSGTINVNAIKQSLRDGKDQLMHDNVELQQLYDTVMELHLRLMRAAELGELLIPKIEEMAKAETDPSSKNALENLLHNVSMRTQDLRTMQQANEQFFISINLTTDNNVKLGSTIDRTMTVIGTLVTVGVAINQALHNQKLAIAQVRATQEYTGQLLKGNAQAIKEQTAEIGGMYKSAVISMAAIEEAHATLLSAIEETEKSKREGVDLAKAGLAKLATINRSMAEKREGLEKSSESRGTFIEL